jgi:hypothetical protein
MRLVILVALFAAGAFSAALAQSADRVIEQILRANKLQCAEILQRNAVGTNQLEVTCVESIGATGRAIYMLDITTGKAIRAR